MIKKIYVKNYILIDELSINFDKGLNVITGETGAGKSILINAIDIAFGAKTTKELVKTGTEKATIELVIDISKHDLTSLFSENGIEDFDNELILTKEITKTSSRTRVNGTLVNSDFIRNLKDAFLDINSQHQAYSFLQPKLHIHLLDSYAKDLYGKELDEYRQLYKNYCDLKNKLSKATENTAMTESQIDFLKFQINEIEEANIQNIDEEDELIKELSILENSEKLKELTESSYWAINGDDNSIISAILDIKSNISKASDLDNSLQETNEMIITVLDSLKTASSELRDYYQSMEFDGERLNEIQERLYLFEKLKKKYGSNLSEILNSLDKFTEELNSIEFSTQNIEELKNEIDKTYKELTVLAKSISDKRKDYAQVLSSMVVDELEKLELPKSRFNIAINEIEPSSDGIDNVEFMISTNVSEDLKPLAKVASGGEISRIILAIKTIFANSDDIDTVIFDEIDTGISGKAAQSVADEIFELSKYRQIIVITHHAVIAAKSNTHFLVTKNQDETTTVSIKELTEDEKINAIAQLASGDINDTSIDFARSLVKNQ